MKRALSMVTLLVVGVGGCAQEVDLSAEEAAIRAANKDWQEAAQAKDLDHFLSFYAEDAMVFPPNAPLASGKDAIRSLWSGLMANPGFDLSWEPVKVEVAKAGDLAWVQETFELQFQNPEGELVQDRGKAILIWKKQPDGSWKGAADIFNSDLAAPELVTE